MNPKMHHWTNAVLISVLLTACVHSQITHEDPQSALEGNDLTGLIQGCGNLASGYLVCRMREGDSTAVTLSFVAPPSKCSREACQYFKLFGKDGCLILGGSIPKGHTSKAVTWKEILGKDKFEHEDRGIFGFTYTVYWTDGLGVERKSYASGEIFLRVTKADYQSLAQVEDDPNFVWKWKEGDHHVVKATTGMRIFVR